MISNYKKEVDNKVVDALSRLPHSEATYNAVTVSSPACLVEGILRYKSKLYIGEGKCIKQAIMASVHSSAVGGHSGTYATYTRAKAYFFWPDMKIDIFWFVISCDICQKNKGEHTHPPGLLQPLPVPEQSWQHKSMDFIEGLPKSDKKSVILVVVDILTKYNHFIGMSHPYTAITIAIAFINNVIKLPGLPSSIISDRDKDTLHKSHERMKIFADRKRSDRVFEVGDWVYIKLQPYRQTSIALRKNFKLSAKYYGPFQVLQKVVALDYKLQLPTRIRVHHIFHVSQLKKQIGLSHTSSLQLPLVDHEGQVVVDPVALWTLDLSSEMVCRSLNYSFSGKFFGGGCNLTGHFHCFCSFP
ncbi:uncharacterized protein K02A2.6-like [Papaver somniferum]|uniref:uncharacterized protein K02A2.6-like n=1 Tax=Papaver somniferum TaxID=3469 RepID=UPI000E6FEE2E|nr:uncharacterized protein K02A2.6-like [Papaver somniferum]